MIHSTINELLKKALLITKLVFYFNFVGENMVQQTLYNSHPKKKKKKDIIQFDIDCHHDSHANENYKP